MQPSRPSANKPPEDMKIIFIADAHLKGEGEANEAELTRFLNGMDDADYLVILGDLFDFWTGRNSEARVRYRSVLRALKGVHDRGVRLIYVEGNHDFSMGRFFTVTLEARIVRESAVMELGGRKFYLAHGDTVDMTGGYRLWRGFLRSPVFSALSMALPSSLVWSIAGGLSGRSRSYNTKGPVLDSHLREFARRQLEGGVDFVVMAHSHMAGVHEINGGTYANPGGWEGERTYLVYEGGRMEVRKYS